MSAEPESLFGEEADCVIFRDGPLWNGRPAATIGRVRCATVAAGATLLRKAAYQLADEGCAAVVGPMDGDTWRNYRAITETDGSPPFLLEPSAGPMVAAAFQESGFRPVSSYASARVALEDAIGDGPPVTVDGVSIAAWDGTDAEELISQLFTMSSRIFAGNLFYKPIAREAFLELYRPVMPAIDRRLVLFARDGSGELIGFLFGLPNHLEGPAPKAVILKTYASRMKGVGRVLADCFHRAARDIGFTEVIHALMHDDNVSRASSERFRARTFRRYTLFGLPLAP